MFATLIAVVVALVLGHVAPHSLARLRRFGWFGGWLDWLGQRAGDSRGWQGWPRLLLVLLPLLLVILLQVSLHLREWDFLGFLFGVLLLVYAWGPRDLDVDVESVLDAAEPSARRQAAQQLGVSSEAAGMDGGELVDAVFVGALRRWFGVLFWFVLLGPGGALLYRLASLCSNEFSERLPARTLAAAQQLRALLEWPVAHLLSISLALVGNFDAVWAAWRNAGWACLDPQAAGLRAAGRASVRSELEEEVTDYVSEGMVPQLRDLPELRDAMSLVWRVMLLWLAILALFVIAGWIS